MKATCIHDPGRRSLDADIVLDGHQRNGTSHRVPQRHGTFQDREHRRSHDLIDPAGHRRQCGHDPDNLWTDAQESQQTFLMNKNTQNVHTFDETLCQKRSMDHGQKKGKRDQIG